MANYFVINSKFKPYSFDELIKPYQLYGQAYKEQEAILDAAREKEFSSDYLDQTQDEAAYDMYNTATQGLQSVSDELATKGLSSELRGRLRTAARDYQKTMGVLNEAQQRLYAERDRRAKLGEDYVYQQDNLRIGDFLNGATPNQRGAKLSDIANDIAVEFGSRAKTITKDTWDKVFDRNGKVIGGIYDITTEAGLTNAQLDTILSDESRWKELTSGLSASEKDELQRFRDIITAKKKAIEYDEYSLGNQGLIDNAIGKGATAGLIAESHKYQQEPGYNPLGWEQLRQQKTRYQDALTAQETPWEHTDEKKASPQNRTGNLKPGWIWDAKAKSPRWVGTETDANGNVVTKVDVGTGGTGTSYDYTTKGLTVHVNGKTSTHDSWQQARSSTTTSVGPFASGKGTLDNISPVAIGDVTDPEIQRSALARINVPTGGKTDEEIDRIYKAHLSDLLHLTIGVRGTKEKVKDKKGGEVWKESDDYAWSIQDKTVQRDPYGDVSYDYGTEQAGQDNLLYGLTPQQLAALQEAAESE